MSLGSLQENRFSAIGKSIPRVDALAKVLGKAQYTQDLHRNSPDSTKSQEPLFLLQIS